jgi:hypothetical protein
MAESRIQVQEISFEGHRAGVFAVYIADASGMYRFARFELAERKKRGPKPGKRRGRKPGPKPGHKRAYKRRVGRPKQTNSPAS